MIGPVLKRVAAGLAWFGAVVLFVLSPAIGSISSIVAVAVALLLSPLVLRPGSSSLIRAQPAMLMFLASFLSIAICYQATARHPTDVLLAVNFLALPLAPVVYLAARRAAGRQTIVIVSALFAAGDVVAVLMGGYDLAIRHVGRAAGIAQGGNLMARTVVLLAFMATASALVTARRWWWVCGGGLVLSMVALYLTQTRGVFIAVPVLGLILVGAVMRPRRAPRSWYAIGAAVVLAAVVAVAVVSPRFLGLGEVLGQLGTNPAQLSDSSAAERLYLWHAGWVTFLKSPLIGFGWANFTEASLPYGIYFYHNDFLDMAVAAGVVGIACWLAIIAAPVIGVLALPRRPAYGAALLRPDPERQPPDLRADRMTLGYDLPTTLHAFLTALVLGAYQEPEPGGEPEGQIGHATSTPPQPPPA